MPATPPPEFGGILTTIDEKLFWVGGRMPWLQSIEHVRFKVMVPAAGLEPAHRLLSEGF